MSSHKTNNSCLKEKILLRLLNLPDKEEIRILDCYHGSGMVWKNVQANTNKKLIIDGIDIKEYEDQFSLVGDNLKIIESLDLNKYDIIDLDAYGVPDKQIEIVIKNTKQCLIFFTFIQSMAGRITDNILLKLGFTKNMIDKCNSIFNKNGLKYFFDFISLQIRHNGIYYSKGNKIYGMFRREKE